MKIEKWISIEREIEVEITAEDLRTLYLEDKAETQSQVARLAARAHQVLEALDVDMLSEKQRDVIAAAMLRLAEKYETGMGPSRYLALDLNAAGKEQRSGGRMVAGTRTFEETLNDDGRWLLRELALTSKVVDDLRQAFKHEFPESLTSEQREELFTAIASWKRGKGYGLTTEDINALSREADKKGADDQ